MSELLALPASRLLSEAAKLDTLDASTVTVDLLPLPKHISTLPF